MELKEKLQTLSDLAVDLDTLLDCLQTALNKWRNYGTMVEGHTSFFNKSLNPSYAEFEKAVKLHNKYCDRQRQI